VRIVHTVKGVVSSIDAKLQPRHRVIITWDAEDTLGFGATERQNSVRKKRKDDGYFLVRIVTFLQPDDSI
jgi:hypothetical protein